MSPTLTRALEYARTHGTTLTETARALGIKPMTLEGVASKARQAGHAIEFPKKAPAKVVMPSLLRRALAYSHEHGATMTETARAMGISPEALNGSCARARKAGAVFEWARVGGVKVEAPAPTPAPAPRQTTDPSDVPLDLIRHVRNGTAFWEERPAPIGNPSRGPSRPVPVAPSNAAERHHTAVGIAWRLDVRPAVVELARRVLRLPTVMTDAEAAAITRLIRDAAPSHTPDPPAPR
jgi:transposase-like protein